MFSSKLIECINQISHSQLQYRKYVDGVEFCGVPVYWHGLAVNLVFFDPWSGKKISKSFKYCCEDDNQSIDNLNEEKKIQKVQHLNFGRCDVLSYLVDGGKEEGLTPIIHVPNIRTYAILNKKEYGGFEPMDYCPFCGAKFPERLDNKLSEILQKEYGLNYWKDYKKAPHEFWTDEWWKKRGL